MKKKKNPNNLMNNLRKSHNLYSQKNLRENGKNQKDILPFTKRSYQSKKCQVKLLLNKSTILIESAVATSFVFSFEAVNFEVRAVVDVVVKPDY